ncbi:MAG: M1 family metallopeptidase [Clostridia bacterium]|nr:M1 family metallopeptidase [Clostridia bacterium]
MRILAKHPIKRLIALIVAMLLCCGGLFPALAALPEAAQGLDRYEIDIVMDAARAVLACTQRVRYTNRSQDTLNNLYFHAYPNAFKREYTSPAADPELSAYPRGFDPGEIAFSGVWVEGEAVAFALQGIDEAVLRVPVGLLAPGQEVALEFAYTLRVPLAHYRFGRSEGDVWNLGNAFPIAAMYEYGEWRLDPYVSIGDPFYSACADYRVTVDLPRGFEVAASGAPREREEAGGRTRWAFEIAGAREFALCFGKGFRVESAVADGVLVQAYATSGGRARRALQYAQSALRTYAELFGPYPHPSFSVAEAALGGLGNMEYPGLAMIDLVQLERSGALEFEMAHVVAHQWWYAQVGSDQVRSPWLDEALAEYSALLYYERAHGQEAFDRLYEQRVESAMRITLPSDRTIGAEIGRFASRWEYKMVVYQRGAGMLHGLRLALGEEVFLRALRAYLEAHRFGIATRPDLVRAFNEAGGSNWQGYFDDYLDGAF